jgi:hypothetical protein
MHKQLPLSHLTAQFIAFTGCILHCVLREGLIALREVKQKSRDQGKVSCERKTSECSWRTVNKRCKCRPTERKWCCRKHTRQHLVRDYLRLPERKHQHFAWRTAQQTIADRQAAHGSTSSSATTISSSSSSSAVRTGNSPNQDRASSAHHGPGRPRSRRQPVFQLRRASEPGVAEEDFNAPTCHRARADRS